MHFMMAARAAHRARESAQLMQAHIVGLEVGDQRFQGHRAGDLRLLEPAVDIEQMHGAHRRQQIGAVDGRQSVARLQSRNRDAGPLQRAFPGRRSPR